MADWKKVRQQIQKEKDPDKAEKILQDAFRKEEEEKSKKVSGQKNLKEHAELNAQLAETANRLGDIQEGRKATMKSLEAELEFQIRKNVTDEEELKKRLAGLEAIKDGKQANFDAEELAAMNIEQWQLDELQRVTKLSKVNKEAIRDQEELMENLSGALGVNVNFSKSFLGNMVKVADTMALQNEEGERARMLLAENLATTFSWQNLAASTFMKIFETTMALVKGFDEARASVASATGAGYEFQDSMFQAQREGNLMGIAMKDVADATNALYGSTSAFAKASEEARTEMILTTAALGKIGVDAGTAAETFQFLNLNLGMTEDQALKTQKSLAMMGTKIGISSEKMTKDFNAALPTLAVYGKEAVDVFTNLASAAKAAGVETSTLLGIAKQYDTFAGAAEGAGKLNALLGTQLSTTQMLMMTEDERIETLVESVQAQGVAFGDMDKYTQLAIANAAGIDDINEAQKIFGMNLADYQQNKDMMDKNADATKKFEDAVQKTVPVFTQFTNLFTELVTVAQPILDFLGTVAEKLTTWLKEMDTGTKNVMVGVMALVTGIPLLVITIMSMVKAFRAWMMWGSKAAKVTEVVGQSSKRTLKSVGKGIKSITRSIATSIKTFASSLATAGPSVATFVTSVGTGVGGAFQAVGIGIAGAMTAIAGGFQALNAATFGFAGILITGAGVAILLQMTAAAMTMANAMLVKAKAEYEMQKSGVKLADATDRVLSNLAKIAGGDFSAATEAMNELVTSANALGNIDIKARATIENLALISVGKAKDSMTGDVISAAGTNLTANVENVFKDMKMVIQVDDSTSFRGYVKKVASEAANH